jgi:hypothetical protein
MENGIGHSPAFREKRGEREREDDVKRSPTPRCLKRQLARTVYTTLKAEPALT